MRKKAWASTAFAIAPLIFQFAATRAAGQGTLQVVAAAPAAQRLDAPPASEIRVHFDRPLAPASVADGAVQYFGRWSGVVPGAARLEDGDSTLVFVPARSPSAGEWMTATIRKSIAGAAGDTLPGAFSWNFWTAAGRTAGDLELVGRLGVRRAGEGRIRTYGAYAGDLNGDGFHDFTVPNEDSHDIRVFLNDGTGFYSGFTVWPLQTNAFPSTNEGADFDGDGMLDFAVGNIVGNSVSILLGDGQGRFRSTTTYPAGAGVRGLAVLDVDSDGDMDVVTANRAGSSISILRNLGDGRFGAAATMGTDMQGETAAAAADMNGDGLLDVVIGARDSRELQVFLCDGEGGLKAAGKIDVEGACWMIAIGDVDGDGNADVVSANSEQNRAAVVRGDGRGGLGTPVLYPTGRFPLAIELGDLDGDGDLDLVTSNFSSGDWTVLMNDGAGGFGESRRLEAGQSGSCAVLHDRDRDGDLDMTGIDELDDQLFLFENRGTPTGVATSGEQGDGTVREFRLETAWPNPASVGDVRVDGLRLEFSSDAARRVSVAVYTIGGRRVRDFGAARIGAGRTSVRLQPGRLAPGVYIVTARSGPVVSARKWLVLP